MNDGYLAADCVFDTLNNLGFIYFLEWKHDTKELYYTVSFIIRGTRASTASFEVIVSDGRHMVTKSIIRLLEKRYERDFTVVFSNCVME